MDRRQPAPPPALPCCRPPCRRSRKPLRSDSRESTRQAAGGPLPAAVWRPGRNGGCWKRYHTLDRGTTSASPELRERWRWWRCDRSRSAALTFILPMPAPILTLTSDFGLTDHYVAVMKGVILTICPQPRIE